jgi:hypothetical protein
MLSLKAEMKNGDKNYKRRAHKLKNSKHFNFKFETKGFDPTSTLLDEEIC